MEIILDLKIIIFIIIFYFSKQLKIYFLFMIFALIHELSHIFIARLLGNKLKKFKIMPIGFSIYIKTNLEDYNKKILKGSKYNLNKILIYLAGPLTNIVVVFFVYVINKNLLEIIYINIIIAVFNMLPIYPLDGSKILRNALKIFFKNEKAYYYTNIVSNLALIICSIIFFLISIYLKNFIILIIIMYLWYVGIKENQIQKIRNKIYI